MRSQPAEPLPRRSPVMLWLLAVILVIIGVVQLLQGQLLFALLLFVAAALVGPGGYQLGRGRRV